MSRSHRYVPLMAAAAVVLWAALTPLHHAFGADTTTVVNTVAPVDPVKAVLNDVVTVLVGLVGVLISWVGAQVGRAIKQHVDAQSAAVAQQLINVAADTALHAAQSKVQSMIDAGVDRSALHSTVVEGAAAAMQGLVGPLLAKVGLGAAGLQTTLVGRLRAMDPTLTWTPPTVVLPEGVLSTTLPAGAVTTTVSTVLPPADPAAPAVAS